MNKLFSVNNKNNVIEIYVLGIKIKYSINKKLYKKKLNPFLKAQKEYINRPRKTIKRRLFLTTGNLNLLNSMTIIKQLNAKDCEDDLLIYSHIINPEFDECCQKIASLHTFHKIHTLYGTEFKFEEYFVLNDLYEYDEIYFSNQEQFINLTKKIFPYADWIITDEGAAGKLYDESCDYNKAKHLIGHTYLGKLDYFGFSQETLKKVIEVDKSVFLNIANKCAEFYPLNVNLNPEDKAIIFCGLWYEASGFEKDEYIRIQNEIIEKLINLGYKILFKPHPRDPRKYIDNENVIMLETRLPLECYNHPNIVGTVSILSNSTLNMYYFQGIAGFSPHIINNPEYKPNFDKDFAIVKFMVQEYTTPIEDLYSIDANNYSPKELKYILNEKCKQYTNRKTLLTKNKVFIDFINNLNITNN